MSPAQLRRFKVRKLVQEEYARKGSRWHLNICGLRGTLRLVLVSGPSVTFELSASTLSGQHHGGHCLVTKNLDSRENTH